MSEIVEPVDGPSARRLIPSTSETPLEVKLGNRFLMNVDGRNFMVEVTAIEGDTMRVTFPGIDYPVEGMQVDLELHDAEGFSYFQTQVVQGPRTDGDGVVLQIPNQAHRSTHRDSARIPTDLNVQLKDEVEGATSPGKLRNLSSGGALIETPAELAAGVTVTAVVELPESLHCIVYVQILHITEARTTDLGPVYAYGTRFTGYEPGAGRILTQYLWKRLAELYPAV